MKGRKAFMKNYFSFFILFILVNLAAQAQSESLFSNYMLMRSVTNRSFVGADKAINAVFCNHTSFLGFNNDMENQGIPVTSAFGVDAPVEIFGKKCGAGILMLSDKIGFQNNIKFDLSLAYHHVLESATLGFGLSLGFNNYTIDPSWNLGEMDDADYSDYWASESEDDLIPVKSPSAMIFALGLGAYYETPSYYIGLNASNINRGDISRISEGGQEYIYSYYAAHFNLSGAYNIALPDPLFDLQPSAVLRTDLAAYSLDLNATMFYKKRHWAGFGLRMSPANIASFTLLFGTELKNSLLVGYALDVNMGGIGSMGGFTSHEIVVTYSFNIESKRDMKYKSVRYL